MFWEVSPLPPIVLAWWGVRQVQRESSVENTKPALCCVCILISSNKSNLLALHSALLCVFKYMAGPPSANRAIIPRLATGGLTLVTVLSSKDLIQPLYLWCRQLVKYLCWLMLRFRQYIKIYWIDTGWSETVNCRFFLTDQKLSKSA